MKVSIYTPTHNAKYLLEAYDSIKEQSFDEWVIVPNGDANIPDGLLYDPRIKIYPHVSGSGYVGELKKFATEKCTGDILVELDHDDLLMPTAIEEIRKAFEDPSVGFAYSNHADFKGDFEKAPRYSAAHGWQWRQFTYKGHELDEVIAFEPDHVSVSRIWYAPNHFRAWRKTALVAAGGDDPSFEVLDDQDLMARTFIVTKMHHIDKPLYLYRIDNNNTWLRLNAKIQEGVYPIYNKYIFHMSVVWAKSQGLRTLDFGGAFNGDSRLECIDLSTGYDLNKPLDIPDNSVGVIRANDVLEHLDDKLHIIKEMYRILAPGGIIFSSTPSALSQAAFQDPTHKQFYVENSFKYYTQKRYAQYIGTPVRFQAIQLYTNPVDKEGCSWIYAHLVALKGQRIPGIVEI